MKIFLAFSFINFLIRFDVNSEITAKERLKHVSTFQQYINEFPEYMHCKTKFIEKLDPSSRLLREKECDERSELFTQALKDVHEHNAKNLGWTKELNKFSVMTVKEKSAYLGRSRQFNYHTSTESILSIQSASFKSVASLPLSVDWRQKNVITPIKSQGGCGSCWAYAAGAAIESFAAINSSVLKVLSTQQLTSCTPNPNHCGGSGGCGGSTQELAFSYVANSSGLLLYSDYPDTSATTGITGMCKTAGPQPLIRASPAVELDGFVQLPPNNYTALMNAVALLGPVTVSFDSGGLFAYSSGIVTCVEKWTINHAVQLVGYGEEKGVKYWLARNSWGPNFGEQGYFRMLRSDKDSSLCGWDTKPQDGSACVGEKDPILVCGSCGILSDSSYPIGVRLAPTHPSLRPSEEPSTNPISSTTKTTSKPSINPTTLPTSKLSWNPSTKPTRASSSLSTCPTVIPTTTKSTKIPSSKPSTGPSQKPSAGPTRAPSRNPSSGPTCAPSRKPPTRAPSGMFSVVRTPSCSPSQKSSKLPSQRPAVN